MLKFVQNNTINTFRVSISTNKCEISIGYLHLLLLQNNTLPFQLKTAMGNQNRRTEQKDIYMVLNSTYYNSIVYHLKKEEQQLKRNQSISHFIINGRNPNKQTAIKVLRCRRGTFFGNDNVFYRASSHVLSNTVSSFLFPQKSKPCLC